MMDEHRRESLTGWGGTGRDRKNTVENEENFDSSGKKEESDEMES